MTNSTLWGLFLYVIIGIIILIVAKIIWKERKKHFPIKNSFGDTLNRQIIHNIHSTKTRIALFIWRIGLEFFALYLCVCVSCEIFLPPINIVSITLILFMILDVVLILKDIFDINKYKKL